MTQHNPQPVQVNVQMPQQKSGCLRTGLAIIGGLVVLCVIGFIIISATSSKPTDVNATAPVGQVAKVSEATSAPAIATIVSTAVDTGAPVIGRVGTPQESGGIWVRVNSVYRIGEISSVKADTGKTYLVCDVTIKTTTRDSAPYNPLYFKLKDSGGYEYTVSLFTPDPSLKSGDLPKGEMVSGNIAFEIGETAKGLIVSYEPMVLLGGYETIKIDLAQ